MKKLHLIPIAALGAFLLTGCATSGLETSPESLSSIPASEQSIGFSTYTGRAVTKATDLNQDFNVEAFLSGTGTRTLYFHPTAYRYASGSYTGDTVRYWPLDKTQNLDFYAVSPLKYKNTDSGDVDLKPSADSTIVLTKTDGTTDVVAARVLNAPNGDTPAAVALTFGHKLTKVAFTAVGQDQYKKYVISGLTLTANSTSTYSYDNAATSTAENWSDSGDEYTYTYVSSDVTIAAGTSTSQAVGSVKYLIPNQASTLTATVSYKIYETSGGTDVLIGDNSAGISVSLPTESWGINKSVVYNLKLGVTASPTSAGKIVTFTADVDDWDAYTAVDQTVPVVSSAPVYTEGGYSGEGIKIGDTWLAPVNCGYDATNYPYGLLYQWGRKYGQGYDTDGDYPGKSGGSQSIEDISAGKLTSHPDSDDYNGKFYKGMYDWYGGTDQDGLWNSGTEDAPTKNSYDPCPEGWRVPTVDELGKLFYTDWDSSSKSGNTQRGSWDDTNKGWNFDTLFLPGAGFRDCFQGNANYRGGYGLYWSSFLDVNYDALLVIFTSGQMIIDNTYNAYGCSIRCVQE